VNRIGWWLVDVTSQMLEPAEREVVRGDFAESGESANQALRDLVGLIARRQASLWKDWHPWLALVGLVVPLGFLLSYRSLRLDGSSRLYLWIIRNYATLDPAILEQTGLTLRHGIPPLVCGSLLLFSWSWICGYVLGTLSRRTIWFNGSIFYLVLFLTGIWGASPIREYQYRVDGNAFALSLYTAILQLKVQAALVVLPSVWGMYQSGRPGALPLGKTILWAAAIVAALVVQDRFWILPRAAGLQMLAGFWPIVYMVATTVMQHRRARSTAC
jgi:hypothetical protein